MTRSPVLYAILFLAACHSRPHYPPGGYAYPAHLDGKDTEFYFYPLKDKLSRLDSFRDCWTPIIFGALDEPNLSLKPLPEPVYRFYYTGWRQGNLVISLTPNEITVKWHGDEHFKYTIDTNRLEPIERQHVDFFDRYYGKEIRTDTGRTRRRARYVDSMKRTYPRLTDPAYYWELKRKEMLPDSQATPYTLTKRTITPTDYQHFVDLLNASGYWEMPYQRGCNEMIADGPDYFFLEANTPEKYNFVAGYTCPNDTNNFYKACQQLVRYAKLDKTYNLVWIEKSADSTITQPPRAVQDIQLEEVKAPRKRKHRR